MKTLILSILTITILASCKQETPEQRAERNSHKLFVALNAKTDSKFLNVLKQKINSVKNMNSVQYSGLTPIAFFLASIQGKDSVDSEICYQAIKLLAAAGVGVTQPTSINDWTPLQYALSAPSNCNTTRIVEALIESGANVNEPYPDSLWFWEREVDSLPRYPVTNAVLCNRPEVLRVLLKHGATFYPNTCVNRKVITLREYARQSNDTLSVQIIDSIRSIKK